MIEIDGPPLAWFEDAHGIRYTYTVYAIISDTPAECLQSFANWYADYTDYDGILVWRMRPALVSDQDFETGITRWKMHCRVTKLPTNAAIPALPEKHELGMVAHYTP